jgi:hypothetical protein
MRANETPDAKFASPTSALAMLFFETFSTSHNRARNLPLIIKMAVAARTLRIGTSLIHNRCKWMLMLCQV